MARLQLANGQVVNVDQSNVQQVTQQAIAAQQAANAAKGQSFGYSDQVAISTAVSEAASGNVTAEPSDYTFFGTTSTSTTGVVLQNSEAGLLGAGLGATSAGPDAVKQALSNLGINLPDLPNTTEIILILGIGVVGLLALAYIAHKAL